jgi:acetate kinase
MAKFLNKNILVINCGSSSIKFQVINPISRILTISGIAERLSTPRASLKVKRHNSDDKTTINLGQADHLKAFEKVSQLITDQEQQIGAIGHRVVHGGDYFKSSALITDQVKEQIKNLFPLAPLHNPQNLLGIEIMEKSFPNLKQVAVFDTSFHVASMPAKAYRYAIPEDWYLSYGVRKFGFHGTSHKFVASEAAKILDKPFEELNLITCHLGHGCSIAAIKDGHTVDTSMGFSPLEGLMMGARSGDLDPTVISYMCTRLGCHPGSLLTKLNNESGFGAIAHGVQDSRDLEDLYLKGDEKAILAIDMFCYRAAKYIASYFVPLGQVPDALVFTAGIGERSPIKRQNILELLKPFGYQIKTKNNDKNQTVISDSPTTLVIPTNEELVIAQETAKFID